MKIAPIDEAVRRDLERELNLLIEGCHRHGFVPRIETTSKEPLAMGRFTQQGTVDYGNAHYRKVPQ